jgi:trehalose 6-phosphate synthase/phosphatase
MVDTINAKYLKDSNNQLVIDYEEVPNLNLSERVALWLVADVFLLTAIREGLNLLPLEYVYARKDLPFAGVVVASEYTACSSLLSGSLKVNPFYILNVADTVHRALEMTSKECAQRLQRDLPFVANHPSSKWTSEILYDLEVSIFLYLNLIFLIYSLSSVCENQALSYNQKM